MAKSASEDSRKNQKASKTTHSVPVAFNRTYWTSPAIMVSQHDDHWWMVLEYDISLRETRWFSLRFEGFFHLPIACSLNESLRLLKYVRGCVPL